MSKSTTKKSKKTSIRNNGKYSLIIGKKVYKCKSGDKIVSGKKCRGKNGKLYDPMTKIDTWSLLGMLSFVAAVVINGLANTLEFGGNTTGSISDKYPNLFAPATFTFSIWFVIYVAVGLYTLTEIQSTRKIAFASSNRTLINQLFFLSNLINIGWIFSWHYDQIGVSLGLMIGLFLTLALIYGNLNKNTDGLYQDQNLLARIPFSIYFGWISVALVANISTFLVSIEWDRFGVSASIWTVIILTVVTFIGIFMMSMKGDIAYVSVLVWAFIGIFMKRYNNEQDPWVLTAVGIGLVFLVFELFFGSYRNAKKLKMMCK